MPRTCAGDQTRCQFVKPFVTLCVILTQMVLCLETVLFHKGQSDSFIMFHNFGHVNLKYKKKTKFFWEIREIF